MNAKVSGWSYSRILAALTALSAAVGAQAAEDAGWYVGAGVGRTKASGLNGIDTTLANYGLTTNSAVDDRDTAWKYLPGTR
jgi:hypothetical protein